MPTTAVVGITVKWQWLLRFSPGFSRSLMNGKVTVTSAFSRCLSYFLEEAFMHGVCISIDGVGSAYMFNHLFSDFRLIATASFKIISVTIYHLWFETDNTSFAASGLFKATRRRRLIARSLDAKNNHIYIFPTMQQYTHCLMTYMCSRHFRW